MMLPEPNRRLILRSALAVVVAGGYLRAARAQAANEFLNPIFFKQDWRDPAEFRRLQRLMWTTFELKYVYRDSFEKTTGSVLPEAAQYIDTVRRLTEKGPEAVPATVPDSAVEGAAPSFEAALDKNGPAFLRWLESLGVAPQGLLATDLLTGQALLSLLGLLLDGYSTLETWSAADDRCAIFYPFC